MGLRCTLLGSPWLSIREAVFTVSPNKQYRGILYPTTPAKTGPVWIPTLICTERTGLKRDHQIPLLLLLRYNLHKIKKTSRYLAPTVWHYPWATNQNQTQTVFITLQNYLVPFQLSSISPCRGHHFLISSPQEEFSCSPTSHTWSQVAYSVLYQTSFIKIHVFEIHLHYMYQQFILLLLNTILL